jgi:hypothetical protein
MPKKIPEKSREEIEIECLRVARLAVGCSHLQRVRIGPLKPKGGAPNWEVFGFSPQLPALAQIEALEVIAPLRQKFSLKRNAKS